ncbi:Imm49 family immunity protein [Streptomyces sp. NPDC048567]|uniref:Imm49 family immunity protein n=1 Tax=Streptomyces sp. NPDC048567 TaxID=3365570 RepID=UPI00371A16D2
MTPSSAASITRCARSPPPAPGPTPSAPSWIDAFHFALICRDQQRLTELCEVPMAVLRGSGTQHDGRTSDALRNYLIQARVISTEYDHTPKK